MSTTINWMIEYMRVKPTEGQYTDVVITAGWRCLGSQVTGTAPNNTTANGSTFGEATFPMPEGEFTPYAQLTQDQVLNWCWENGVDKASNEALVQAQIDNQINPPIIQPPLPW